MKGVGEIVKVNYASYLKLEQLLSLQVPESDPAEHDEMLFIVIHQVYELWFKQFLHELDRAQRDLRANELFGPISTFKRLRMILKTLVGQLDILETMTPMSFNSFRDRLDSASGFQSIQFRAAEFSLGYKREDALKYVDAEWHGYEDLCQRLQAPSIVDGFYRFLVARGVTVSAEALAREGQVTAPDVATQAGLLQLYETEPSIGILLELMLDVDEGLQEWRYRHVKLVERTIGNKHGTGGSLGVDFLKRSLFQPVFPDLWAIRHEF